MKKILIVDDYPDILEGLSYALKDHYEVTTAGNLTEAKKEVSTTAFDVVSNAESFARIATEFLAK
ncbi:response regulator [Enterocloster clostridioformis]|uniref:response regulator n=1 Tax=Enterocloster clostridioformis TaxID=1531 RepID=UPI00094219C3|nr:response regulator [Enterocloster clostridioformis]